MSKGNDKDSDFRAWFSAEWNRLRELYGVADRGREPEPPPATMDDLEEKLAELDELVELARMRVRKNGPKLHPEAMKKFSARLRQVFKEYKLVRKGVSTRMGYKSSSALGQWLGGMAAPTPEIWPKVKDAIRREAGG